MDKIKLSIRLLSLYLTLSLTTVLATPINDEFVIDNSIPHKVNSAANFELFKELPIELVQSILTFAANSPKDLMEWSRINQRFRTIITGYPIKITGKAGETLQDYYEKHCGFSNQDIAGIRNVRNKFHLNINSDSLSKIIYMQREQYIREDNGENISLDKIPSYVLYNLVNRFKNVPYCHWDKIAKTKLKQLSLFIFPSEENYFNNLIQQFKNDDYRVQQLELNFVGHDINFRKDLVCKIKSIQVKHSNSIKCNELFEIIRVDSSNLITSFKPKQFNSLDIEHDTYISNKAFIKILTGLNLKAFKTYDVDLSHITSDDVKEIFEKGPTLQSLSFLNCNFSQDVIKAFLKSLAYKKHHVESFEIVSNTINNNFVYKYSCLRITEDIKKSGVKSFSVKGSGLNRYAELFFNCK